MSKKKPPNLHGLYQRNFPRPLQERVEIDYADKLSPAEKEWLAKFNDEHGAGKFQKIKPLTRSKAKRRELWNEQAAAKRDIYANVPFPMEHPDSNSSDLGEITWEEIPADSNKDLSHQLESHEYRLAKERVAKATPGTPEHKEARRQLRIIVKLLSKLK